MPTHGAIDSLGIHVNKKFLSLAFAATLTGVAMQAATASASNKVAPAANSDNVTICHRTHSTTNPYVLITVDQKSVSNANSKHGGGAHDDWARSLYATKPSPNVFDPSKTYPANDKKWGDIIAFKDVSNNTFSLNAARVMAVMNFAPPSVSTQVTSPPPLRIRRISSQDL